MTTIHVVGAAILDGHRCLVAQRGAGRPFAGFWEFPGGKVEPNERPEEGLAREIREELGIDIDVREHVGQGSARHGDNLIVLDVYAAEILRGDIVLAEHQDVRWAQAHELEHLQWAEADVPIFPKVRELLLSRTKNRP